MIQTNKIDADAAEWVTRLDAGTLDPAQQQQLDQWLAADSRRLGALVRARAQWSDLDRLGALAAGQPTFSAAAPRFPWNRRMVLAASLAGVAAAGISWFALRPGTEFYRTDIGEIRRITLPDGSALVLNTDSEVRIHFEATRRNVHLLRGESLFEVAPDQQRPFVVLAENIHVRAVGTVFAVRLRDEEINVTVSEGLVELARTAAGTALSPLQQIAANQQTVIVHAQPGRVEELAPEVVERRLAWLDGRVAFNGEPLREAVAEINRYSRRTVVIDDAALAARPVVGVFRATDTQAFCRAAAAALGAVVIEETASIHLRSGSDAP